MVEQYLLPSSPSIHTLSRSFLQHLAQSEQVSLFLMQCQRGRMEKIAQQTTPLSSCQLGQH